MFAALPTHASPSQDSIPLQETRQRLEAGDTLGALDILHDWSSKAVVGPELNDLMGRLHLPDEPLDTSNSSQAEEGAKSSRPRKWRLRTDGGVVVSDPWNWNLGTMLTTQIDSMRVFGAPGLVEGGVIAVLWSSSLEPPVWAIEPLIGLSVQAGKWDVRFDGWSGVFEDAWDAGFMAVGSVLEEDSHKIRRRWGSMIRLSLISTSLVGVFCKWDRSTADWAWEWRSDLRLRHDPIRDGLSSGDSVDVQGGRAQAISKGLILRRFGNWGFGPSFGIDLRTSLASDKWIAADSTAKKQVRKDAAIGGGAVAQYSIESGRWVELRMGWTGAAMDSRIDPTYSDRNSGFTTTFATGLSF